MCVYKSICSIHKKFKSIKNNVESSYPLGATPLCLLIHFHMPVLGIIIFSSTSQVTPINKYKLTSLFLLKLMVMVDAVPTFVKWNAGTWSITKYH